jgi:hypothetical protein
MVDQNCKNSNEECKRKEEDTIFGISVHTLWSRRRPRVKCLRRLDQLYRLFTWGVKRGQFPQMLKKKKQGDG